MKNGLQKLNFALPIGSLEAYIARVNQIPLLSQEKEQQLATELRDQNNVEAAKQLLLPHLRFVVSVARGYSGYGLSLGDLIQEGNIGLMKAVKRFDPSQGVRLVSFAVHWIKAEIHEFILRNWRIVKIATTKAQRKLFFNLRKATQHLTRFSEENVKTIATDLNVSNEEVRRMHQRLNSHDESFDGMESDDHESGSSWSPEHYLEDHRYNPALQLESKNWTENREHNLEQALLALDARSQDILRRRWLTEEKATLHDLAAEYQISAERVRQIEKMAMDKIRKTMNS
jgi:RNA polymerase sigma-32 factor